MKNTIFVGCATAMCTPFFENGGINFEEFGKFIEYQIDNKIDALVVCGTTGESATMSIDEKKNAIKYVVEKVNKRVPVIAGTGGNDTKTVIEMTQYAENVGVDGVLIVTPYYNKTTQRGLIKHYELVARNTELPIILYNVPSRTGVNIEPKTCLELSKIKNIVAIKEASGNISQVTKISALCGSDLRIYSGNDDQIVPVLSVGGVGVISVLSNIMPKYVHNLVNEYLLGNMEKSKRMQLESIELIENLFCEVNPIPVKYALNSLGFDFGVPRLPLIEFSEDKKVLLDKCIESFR